MCQLNTNKQEHKNGHNTKGICEIMFRIFILKMITKMCIKLIHLCGDVTDLAAGGEADIPWLWLILNLLLEIFQIPYIRLPHAHQAGHTLHIFISVKTQDHDTQLLFWQNGGSQGNMKFRPNFLSFVQTWVMTLNCYSDKMEDPWHKVMNIICYSDKMEDSRATWN